MLSEHGQLLSRDCRVTRELKQATAPVDPPRSASKLAATVASVASLVEGFGIEPFSDFPPNK